MAAVKNGSLFLLNIISKLREKEKEKSKKKRDLTPFSSLFSFSSVSRTGCRPAIEKSGLPEIIHSDQGREYIAKAYTQFVESLDIQISMSHKGCPWENGYQESFYSQFKVDLGDPSRFKTLGELAVAVYHQIHYYNNLRIHTKLKMPPNQFSQRHNQILTTNSVSIRL